MSKDDEIRRIPKNYDGIFPTGRSLDRLLPKFLKKIQHGVLEDHRVIFNAWFEVVGPRLAPMTEPVSFEKGNLFIKVKNATLHSILAGAEKKRLLDEMRKKLPGVKVNALVFRI